MAEPEITVDKGAEENGLGNMVADLLRANVESSALKKKVFSRMKGAVGLVATDAEVQVTLALRSRTLRHPRRHPPGNSGLVTTDSDSILELSNVRIVGGLPYLFDKAGRGVVGKVARWEIRIRGLLRHPVTLTRLAIVLSVN